MKEAYVNKYCDSCKKETVHVAREDALEIEYNCMECNKHEEMIKTFF
jgi:hypothetical protein